MSSPTLHEVLMVAEEVTRIFAMYDLECCLVGGVGCILYGCSRVPNDVDMVVMTQSYGQETLKQALVNRNPTFYTRAPKQIGATYQVLYYKLGYKQSCKVDILTPGIMNIPFVPSSKIIRRAATDCYRNYGSYAGSSRGSTLPVMPLIPLLMLKLQAWEDHRSSDRFDFRVKQYMDASDVRRLLEIAVEMKVRLEQVEGWLPESFVLAARKRIRKFSEVEGTRSEWKKIGF